MNITSTEEHNRVLAEQYSFSLHDAGIPNRMWGGIIRYLNHGVPPGDFLQAVINNNLKEAFGRADDENQSILINYVKWFYNHAPAGSWGYPGAADKWIKARYSEKQGDAS